MCWLFFVDGGRMCVVRCVLLVVRCSLFAVCCSVCVVCCSVLVVCCVLCVVCGSLRIARSLCVCRLRLMIAVCCVVFADWCLLLGVG